MFVIYIIQYSSEGYLKQYQSPYPVLSSKINDAKFFPSFNAANAYCEVIKSYINGVTYMEVIAVNDEKNTEVEYLYED